MMLPEHTFHKKMKNIFRKATSPIYGLLRTFVR